MEGKSITIEIFIRGTVSIPFIHMEAIVARAEDNMGFIAIAAKDIYNPHYSGDVWIGQGEECFCGNADALRKYKKALEKGLLKIPYGECVLSSSFPQECPFNKSKGGNI